MSSKMLVKVMAHRSIHFTLKFISTGKIEFLGLYVTFLHTSFHHHCQPLDDHRSGPACHSALPVSTIELVKKLLL